MAARNARSNVVQAAFPRTHNRPMKNYPDDDTFFHKGQLRVGSVLVFQGRTNPGSEWQVTRIITYHSTMRGTQYQLARSQTVDAVNKFTDTVQLRNLDSGQRASRMFLSLSYGAQWRLKA